MSANSTDDLDEDARQVAYSYVNTLMWRWAKDTVIKPTGLASYQPRPSDVIINTFMKSGTTFMQQILYQIAVLTNGGPPEDPDGNARIDLSSVVPILEFIPGYRCSQPNITPRVFKSHLTRAAYPSGTQKHVCVVRHPSQIAGSLLDFTTPAFLGVEYAQMSAAVRRLVYDNHTRIMLLGLKTMDDGTPAEETYSPTGRWVDHVSQCVSNLDDNCMVIFYDDLCANTDMYVYRLAAFMGCSVSDATVREVLLRSSRQSMMNNRENYECKVEGLGFGTQLKGRLWKVMNKDRDGFITMTMAAREMDILTSQMRDTLGFESYEQFKAHIVEDQERRFGHLD